MHFKQASFIVFLLFLAIGKSGAERVSDTQNIPTTQAEMHRRVDALYNFHPSKLTDEARQKKSDEMDLFWNEMKGNAAQELPLVRSELRSTPSGSFFLMDGSQLLLSLSKTAEDKQLAADSLARTDLADVQATPYFYTVHSLASDGVDTTQAALHILDRPDFQAIIAMHAMTLDIRDSLMYVTMSMKDDHWVKPAEARFAMEKNIDVRMAIVFALFYEQTDAADAALRRIAAGTPQDPAQKKAQEFIEEENKASKSLIPAVGSVSDIREKRRERLRAVSDEAMDDVQGMTEKLVALRAKGKR